MKKSKTLRQRGVGLAVIALASVWLAGCTGLSIPSERHGREQLNDATAAYRPDGVKPALPALTSESGLSNLLVYAMLNQPKVEAAYYDWAASVERITVARSLPDPQITFQMDIQSIVTSLMPGLMMNFPGPGKLRAGAEVASAESQAKYFAFQSSILESAFEVKRAYYQLHFLEERIGVTRQTLVLLDDLETLARAQNEVGKVTLQDVLRAQIEQDRLKTALANLEDSKQPLREQFKAALGLSAAAETPPAPRVLESTPLDLAEEQLFDTAFTNNTRLQALAAEVRSAEASIILAHKARIPDTSLGVMADVKMNPVLYRPLATISLPIWRDKTAAQLAEAQANKRAAEARLSAEQIALAVAYAEKSFLYREATRNLGLLRGQLLPKQRESLEVARSGYLAGQIDFFNLTDAEQTLLRFGLEEVESQAQREISLAELSLIIQGMPPSGLAMTPNAGNGGSPPSRATKGGSMTSMK